VELANQPVVLKVFPAIAAGCTVILKPSEVAPMWLQRFLSTSIQKPLCL
jgi:acyl-CoA reductase-like NAD-dependent aldehyde dehydrogenase